MAIKKFRPTSPGKRFQTISEFGEITSATPERSLLHPLKKTGGRNAYGRITAWHRGGGHKRKYRVIDFRRDKREIPAKVASVEYDPNRSARIALLHYADGEKRYILAPSQLQVGERVIASPTADIKPSASPRICRADPLLLRYCSSSTPAARNSSAAASRAVRSGKNAASRIG